MHHLSTIMKGLASLSAPPHLLKKKGEKHETYNLSTSGPGKISRVDWIGHMLTSCGALPSIPSFSHLRAYYPRRECLKHFAVACLTRAFTLLYVCTTHFVINSYLKKGKVRVQNCFHLFFFEILKKRIPRKKIEKRANANFVKSAYLAKERKAPKIKCICFTFKFSFSKKKKTKNVKK